MIELPGTTEYTSGQNAWIVDKYINSCFDSDVSTPARRNVLKTWLDLLIEGNEGTGHIERTRNHVHQVCRMFNSTVDVDQDFHRAMESIIDDKEGQFLRTYRLLSEFTFNSHIRNP